MAGEHSQNPRRVLLVEDDTSLVTGLKYTLEKQRFSVDAAGTARKALELFNRGSYDLILLDVGLPDGNGFELCREIRIHSDVPVIFLTACDEEVNVVMGLDMGGDDYITKPFRVTELVARIRAVMRRRQPDRNPPDVIRCGEFRIDRDSCRVYRNGRSFPLTTTEYRLLQVLMQNRGIVLTREKLIELLWDSDEHYVDSNTLSVYISRLREKIEDDSRNPVVIKTVRGIGYQWQ